MAVKRRAGHVIGSSSTLRVTGKSNVARVRRAGNLNRWWNNSRTSAEYRVKKGSRTPNDFIRPVHFARTLKKPSSGNSGG